MSQLGVGKEVLSYCNKCKLTLAHLVMTMKSDTIIGKVQCKTCQNTHAYKDPSNVKASKTKKGKTTKKSTSADSISDIWMNRVASSSSKSQKYSIKAKFELGDIIDHPKFGPGVIDKLIDADKIQVIFRHDIKTLIHNK
jgi:DNA-directed RNA polymerase subunit M/transcription elongation factor TFIIS